MSKARLTRVLAVAALASIALSACAANSNGSGSSSGDNGGSTKVDIPVVTNLPVSPNAVKPAGDGKGKCSGVSLAYAGAKSGANAQLGINIVNGVKLAVKQHNQANPAARSS